MRYFQKLLCLLILVLAASFGVGGCVLLYSDFSVQRSRMAAANAAAHAQACTLLQTEILDLQRRGISTGDAALTARVTAQDVPAALWRGDTLVCATLEGLQSLPLGDAATVTVRTENSIYAVYASDLQGGLGDSLVLQDQDIIFAESSSSGILTSGSGFSLGFLGTGVNYKNPTN